MNRELKIDFIQCFKEMIKRWWIIAITTIIFTGAGICITMNPGVNTYEALATVYSISYGAIDEASTGLYAMQAYAAVIKSTRVANRAAAILEDSSISGEVLKNMVTYEIAEKGNNLLSIYASAQDSDLAIEVADAFAQAFVMEINGITGQENAQILDNATLVSVKNSESGNRNKVRVLLMLLGFTLPCGVIVLKTIFSTKIYTVEDATADGKLRVIGVIPNNREK